MITDKVLVTTGDGLHGEVSEIISVGNMDITCQNFPNGPTDIVSSTGGFVQNEVLICGGYHSSSLKYDPNCWILGQSETIEMAHGRAYSYGIVLNDKVSNLITYVHIFSIISLIMLKECLEVYQSKIPSKIILLL